MKEADRKRELRAFLMSRRARLTPQDVGLPKTPRRRAPGLRREEVAALAGVSTAWYTAFEMAKDHRVSAMTIDAIARALRLSPVEVRHLYLLAGGHSLGPTRPPTRANSADLRRFLLGVVYPSLIFSNRLDVVAMTDAAVELFGPLSEAEGLERNWLWQLFANADLRAAIHDWEDHARYFTSLFRIAYFEWGADEAFDSLLDSLLEKSTVFRDYWLSSELVQLEIAPLLTIDHTACGVLQFRGRSLAFAHSRESMYILVPIAEAIGGEELTCLFKRADRRRTVLHSTASH